MNIPGEVDLIGVIRLVDLNVISDVIVEGLDGADNAEVFSSFVTLDDTELLLIFGWVYWVGALGSMVDIEFISGKVSALIGDIRVVFPFVISFVFFEGLDGVEICFSFVTFNDTKVSLISGRLDWVGVFFSVVNREFARVIGPVVDILEDLNVDV